MAACEPFRWCFIGTSKLANTVAREIVRSRRHEIAAVYSRREESREQFAKRFHAVAYESAEEAIGSPDVDGVYVVTPHASHLDYAKLALELGKPVLCEKPLAVNAVQAEELLRLSEDKGVYLSEAMWTWFSHIAHQVKRWLDEGKFGELEKVYATYHMRIAGKGGRLTDPAAAGGALLDIGVYPIAYLYRLFGYPESIACTGVVKDGVDLFEDIAFTFAGGRSATASVSMVDFRGFEMLSIKGSKASLSMPLFHVANSAVLKRKRRPNQVLKADGGYVNEFDHVVDEIRAGLVESPLVPHAATLDVMRIMDECRRQMGLIYPFEC